MADEAPKADSDRSERRREEGRVQLGDRACRGGQSRGEQLEVELLAYDGKTVVLDVADEALEDLKRLKPGMAPRSAWSKKTASGSRRAFGFVAKDPERRQSRRHVAGSEEIPTGSIGNMRRKSWVN